MRVNIIYIPVVISLCLYIIYIKTQVQLELQLTSTKGDHKEKRSPQNIATTESSHPDNRKVDDFEVNHVQRRSVTGSESGEKELKSKWKELLKCQQLRINRLHERCQKYTNSSTFPQLHKLTDEYLRELTAKFLTDDLHQVMLRTIDKTGMTSWKSVIIKNYVHKLPWMANRTSRVHLWNGLRVQYGLQVLPNYEREGMLMRLTHYYSMLTVRNPLTRLESAFKMVFRFRHEYVKDDQGNEIELDIYQKFEMFIDSVLHGKKNRHWDSIVRHANPCIIPYKFIAKTETSDIDMNYIIQEKLSNVGQALHENAGIKLMYADAQNGDKFLPLFSKLKDPAGSLNKLMKLFGQDMDLFGYKWENRNGEFYATCESHDFGGMCC